MSTVGWLPALGLLALIPWVGYALAPRNAKLAFRLGFAGAMLLPFVAPPNAGRARIVLAVFAVVFAVKAWERYRGRVRDPMMWSHPLRYLIWLLVPPETRVARDRDEAQQNRRGGRVRLRRAGLKFLILGPLLGLPILVPQLIEGPFGHGLWSLWIAYLMVSLTADAVSGGVMLTGLYVDESFDAPALSASPKEFWGKRWNRFVGKFAFRHVFLPLGGIRQPMAATLVVFLFSGLMHEFLVAGAAGQWSPYAGWTLAFFLLQGLAVCGQTHFERVGRPLGPSHRGVAIVLNHVWLVATCPLFFIPLDHASRYSDWWS